MACFGSAEDGELVPGLERALARFRGCPALKQHTAGEAAPSRGPTLFGGPPVREWALGGPLTGSIFPGAVGPGRSPDAPTLKGRIRTITQADPGGPWPLHRPVSPRQGVSYCLHQRIMSPVYI